MNIPGQGLVYNPKRNDDGNIEVDENPRGESQYGGGDTQSTLCGLVGHKE